MKRKWKLFECNGYLEHNTAIAFPTFLVFKDIPEEIEYEMSPKFMPDVV